MPRPRKCRRVGMMPCCKHFRPSEGQINGEVVLTHEELEAIRLKDLSDLEQEECAQQMGISRPTFVRIIDSARKKVADALVNGKEIRIDGGNYVYENHHCCKNEKHRRCEEGGCCE